MPAHLEASPQHWEVPEGLSMHTGSEAMMQCMHCGAPSGGEHHMSCLLYEPPLTQEEIRELRRLLAFTKPVLD